MDFSVSYIYGEAIAISKKHGLTILCLTLITMVAGVGLLFLSMPEGFFEMYAKALQGNTHALKAVQQMQPNTLGQIAQYIVSFFFSAVMYRALIGYIRGTAMTFIDAFKVPAMTFLKFVGTMLAVVIVIIIGLILLVIPGIYVAVRLIWAPMYTIEHPEASIKDAISWSWNATKGHWIELFCLFLVAMVVVFAIVALIAILSALASISGILAGIVIVAGVLVFLGSTVMINFAQTKTYCELTQFSK